MLSFTVRPIQSLVTANNSGCVVWLALFQPSLTDPPPSPLSKLSEKENGEVKDEGWMVCEPYGDSPRVSNKITRSHAGLNADITISNVP